MNKIYKVIWSKAKHCYVVVSELAKNHTKGCGRRSLRRTAVSLGIVAALLGGFSGSAWAAVGVGTGGLEGALTGEDSDATALNTLIGVTSATNVTFGGVTLNDGAISGTSIGVTGAVSGGSLTTSGTLGVTGAATVGSLKIGTSSYGITGEGVATVSSLTIGTTAVDTAGLTGTHTIASGSTGYVSGEAVYNALAAKADATSVSAIDTRLTTAEGGLTTLNTNTQYVSSAGENKTTITGTLEVVGTDNESGGVINVNGLGSGINIAGTGSFLKVGNGSANYALEVDVGNNQVKAASGNIILDSNGALTTKYSGQT